jgi:hypothetical protein
VYSFPGTKEEGEGSVNNVEWKTPRRAEGHGKMALNSTLLGTQH